MTAAIGKSPRLPAAPCPPSQAQRPNGSITSSISSSLQLGRTWCRATRRFPAWVPRSKPQAASPPNLKSTTTTSLPLPKPPPETAWARWCWCRPRPALRQNRDSAAAHAGARPLRPPQRNPDCETAARPERPRPVPQPEAHAHRHTRARAMCQAAAEFPEGVHILEAADIWQAAP